MDTETARKYLKSLDPPKRYIDPDKKYWGWKDGEFGNPLPKFKFKSGFKPKVAFDPPDGMKPDEGAWHCGEWISFKYDVYVDGKWIRRKGCE